jgi:outer membrane beta-barrel protein
MKQIIISILTIAFSFSAYAGSKKSHKSHPAQKKASQSKSLKKDFETLGDNKVFTERVKQMDQEQRVRIVENRIVDLNNRFELAGTYAYSAGGDSYVTTQSLGGILDFHFSPKFAMGIRYQHYFNELTNEGKDQYDAARAAQSIDPAAAQKFAGIDYPEDMGLVTVSYSPIYGKLNLFDMSVAHFDIYTLAGYGKMQLLSGTSDVFAGGVGMGIWITQNFSARVEGRYEAYKDLIGSENRSQSNIHGLVAIGILL